MATKIVLVDDLDNSMEADETVTFALDGTGYEIDLAAENVTRLREVLSEFIEFARKTGRADTGQGGTTRRAGTGSGYDKETLKAIRAWATAQGKAVSDRGRISASIVQEWENRDQEPDSSPKADVTGPGVKKAVAVATRRPAMPTKKTVAARGAAKPASVKPDPQWKVRAGKTTAPTFTGQSG